MGVKDFDDSVLTTPFSVGDLCEEMHRQAWRGEYLRYVWGRVEIIMRPAEVRNG